MLRRAEATLEGFYLPGLYRCASPRSSRAFVLSVSDSYSNTRTSRSSTSSQYDIPRALPLAISLFRFYPNTKTSLTLYHLRVWFISRKLEFASSKRDRTFQSSGSLSLSPTARHTPYNLVEAITTPFHWEFAAIITGIVDSIKPAGFASPFLVHQIYQLHFLLCLLAFQIRAL